MTNLIFIGSFNAFFFIILLLQKKSKLLHDRILIFWLLYLGVATGFYALTVNFFAVSSLLSTGIISSFLLQGPFLYLYVSTLTSNKKHFNPKNLLHFTPFVIFVLYLFIASLFSDYSHGITIDHLSDNAVEPPLFFIILLLITALSGPVYFFLTYKIFLQSKESLLNFSSQDVNLDWLGKLVSIFGVVWTLLIIIAVIHHIFNLFTMDFCINGLFLSLSAFIILIGYFGFKQKDVFISYSIETKAEVSVEPEIKYVATKMEGAELQQCCNKVQNFMESNRPYLDSELTLPKLAEDLNVTTHHLSQVINEVHGENFFNFINKYRVDEVKRKIQDPKYQNYTLLGIAFESGFNSKSAFNRVFKNITGTTPSTYRNSLPTY